jgi:hypothetical protein
MTPEATLKIVGNLSSPEDLADLVEAIELSCMDVDGDSPDVASAVAAAIEDGAPIMLREEEPDFIALDRLERRLKQVGVSYVVGYVGEGANWVESWTPGQAKPIRVPRDENGQPCVVAAEVKQAMQARDYSHLAWLAENAAHAAGEGLPAGMAADFVLEAAAAPAP